MTITNKFKSDKWNEKILKEVIDLLNKSDSVNEACNKLCISRRKLERMFAKHQLLSPASYLPYVNTELTKNQKKRILALYSEIGGSSMSIQDIAAELRVPKDKVKEYINSLNVTHQSLPFTEEEKKNLDSKLIQKAQEIREYKLKAKIESVERDKYKTDAQKWNAWKETVGEDLFKILQHKIDNYEVPKLTLSNTRKNPFCAIFSLQDFHLGRLSSKVEVLDDNDIKSQIDLLLSCIKDLIHKTSGFGTPEKVYITVGGDFINSDNSKSTTTAGTQQDSFPSHAALLIEGGLTLIKMIDLFRQFFPLVELIPSPGNHDRDTSISLYMFVAAWYRNCDDVITNFKELNVRSRQYKQYGNTLLGFMHGDGSKLKNWPIIIANEAREIWGKTTHTVLVTGHKHYRISQDLMGMQHVQVPSLASEDRWSHLNGYQSEKAISLILVDKESGYMAEVVSNAN